jgi:uncharacterized protein YigE (DUF2233 family)
VAEPDATAPNATAPDATAPDAGVLDARVPDAGVLDAGVPDAGVLDAVALDDRSLMVDQRARVDGRLEPGGPAEPEEPRELDGPPGEPRRSGRAAHRRRRRPRTLRWRRIRAVVILALSVVVLWGAVSLGSTLTNPSYGSTVGARFAEWARDHGASSIVNWAENEWYSHHPPPVGGRLPKGALSVPSTTPTTAPPTAPPHLTPPAPMAAVATPALPGEGQWSPAGRTVDGLPAVYVTHLRPDAIHTSYLVGVAWMDTELLRATLYSGSQIPGGGPYPNSAPVSPAASTSLVSAFNAGFLTSDSQGGYYTNGQTQVPLRTGAASFVIYQNGDVAIGAWDRDVSMSSTVVSVRQNLDLLVDGGQVVPGLDANDNNDWGATLGGAVYVWRSGVGITADGALVYVGGPGLNITDLANLLVDAGAVRAMELDINTDWVNYSIYSPATAQAPATPANGSVLVDGMSGGPGRYFESWWSRDFFTMSARPAPAPELPR